MVFYPLAAALISAAFAVTLFAQYQRKPRPFLLAWSIALTVYALAALTEVWGAAGDWSVPLFKAYYFLGGIVLVGILALGTIYLLAHRSARFALMILIALCGLGLIGVVGAHVQPGVLQASGGRVPSLNAIPPERSFFNVVAIAMAVTINIVGTLILIGGALWSAYGLWRRGYPTSRLLTNILIAAGAFIVAGASSLTRFGIYELFYVGQAVGVLVMFAGFLVGTRQPARRASLSSASS
jgi:hypothetical protein